MENREQLEFRLGILGEILPLLTEFALVIWAAASQSNVTGYMVAFFAAIIVGVVLGLVSGLYPLLS